MIDTKTVSRRDLWFNNLDEVVADAERAVAANAVTIGNWSLGQILEHVAVVMEKTVNGFDMKAPLPIRLMGRWFLKNRFLKNGMPAGFQLKGPAAQELLPPEVDANQALEHLHNAAERLQNETHRETHPFFGDLTDQEACLINCRHAALHLSFVQEPSHA
ncbi:MAG: DUF1569 domain-containing protein [Planctomycetota bacterium]